MRYVPNRKREAGIATLPLLVMALGMVLIAVLLGTAMSTAKSLSNSFKSQQREYMMEVQAKVASWYERNLGIESGTGFTIDSAQLFAELGVERRYSVRLVISPQLDDGTVRYHKVAVVSPGTSASGNNASGFGSYDLAGVYTAPDGFALVEFDGKSSQRRSLAETNSKLAKIAEVLEQYVAVRISEDANTDSTNNYFRPLRDCNHVGARDLPCTNGAVNVATFFQSGALLGMSDGAPKQDSWGGDIKVNNDADDPTGSAPFTMTITALTPWGQELIVKAVQPTY